MKTGFIGMMAQLQKTQWLILSVAMLVLIAACAAAEPLESAQNPALAETPSQFESFSLLPGVVVDPARALVFIMRPGGGIEALQLKDGRVQWDSNQADMPLFSVNGVLLAQIESSAAGIVVARLDARTGRLADGAGDPLILQLPSAIVAVIDQTLERTFRHTMTQSDGEIYLNWESVEREVTGVSPPGGRAFARHESGVFRFHSGIFEAVQPGSIPAPGNNYPENVREYLENARLRRPLWHAGEVLAVARQRYAPDELVLERWQQGSGEPLSPTMLYQGRAIAVLASCDQRHVVVAVNNGQSAPGTPYLLRFHALDNGELLAQIPAQRSAGPFCLLGSRLLRLSQPELRRVDGVMVDKPLELIAGDLSSGAVAWRRAVRDTMFKGIVPPRN